MEESYENNPREKLARIIEETFYFNYLKELFK